MDPETLVRMIQDGINLDAMFASDLQEFVDSDASLAMLVFGIQDIGLLKCYAQTKLWAMQCRETGNVRMAQTYEERCDAIFLQLPSSLCW